MRTSAMVGTLALGIVAWLAVMTASDVIAQPPPKPQSQEIFSGTLTLQRPQVSGVKVAVHLWTVQGGQKHAALEIPGKGMMVVQVRAGTLTTIIGGKRQERKEGEFMTVPSGVPIGVETGNDTAVLQTVLIEE